ncbi:hypothetical protein ACJX0J_040727, partial [Zea mays]
RRPQPLAAPPVPTVAIHGGCATPARVHDLGHQPTASPVPGASDIVAADEVCTIFMDLPADVKERELHNLLCWLLGFETSEMNFKGNQPMGFALFSTVHQAITAKAMFQDTVFDAETKVALQTDMAKKNLFVKRSNWLDLVKGGFIANVQCAE